MKQNRRRTGSRRSADDKIKYMRMAAIPLLVVIVLVVIILVMDKKPKGQEAVATGSGISSEASAGSQGEDSQGQGSQEGQEGQSKGGQGQEESVAPDNSQYTTDFSDYELQKDAIPQVNQLISEYFQAKVDQDADKLYQLFGKTPDESMASRKEELKDEAVYIEDYQNIVCYTKPGLTADSYVVYVTYDVKFRRVDTLAPGLMWCYVVKDDNGNYIIRENVVGAEADYVEKQNQSEDVRLLSNQVNERLRQAINSDSLLAGIYKDLRNGAVVPSSEDGGQDSNVYLEDNASAASGADGATQAPGSDAQSAGNDTQPAGAPSAGDEAQPAGAPSAGSDTQPAGAPSAGDDTKPAGANTEGTASKTSGGSAVKIN